MEDKQVQIRLKHLEGLQFLVEFGGDDVELLMDEPEPIGSDKGPNAAKVLSAAIGNCLTASLLFCLRRAHAEPKSIEATVSTAITRTDKGRMRIGGSKVEITLDMPEDAANRMGRCMDLFEDFCIVTESVRKGIDVAAVVKSPDGDVIYDSTDNHR
ncbi:MAG: OsmC family protein [candidate division Zixibacteria bacterium]|nr:OsmC family protein [candidate division Zixibacteria bacterium]